MHHAFNEWLFSKAIGNSHCNEIIILHTEFKLNSKLFDCHRKKEKYDYYKLQKSTVENNMSLFINPYQSKNGVLELDIFKLTFLTISTNLMQSVSKLYQTKNLFPIITWIKK